MVLGDNIVKKSIVLKLSGELFAQPETLHNVLKQLEKLCLTHHVGLVVGGGNLFRARNQGIAWNLQQTTADSIGMLATVMNGLLLQDLCKQHNIPTRLLSACEIPRFVLPITSHAITQAKESDHTIIFAGGTGNPFFTTDTNAVLRALEIGAGEVWKGTDVDYIYDQDPAKNPNALQLKKITYTYALEHNLAIMDRTAFALAQNYKLALRVFNIFKPQALELMAQDSLFGSTVTDS